MNVFQRLLRKLNILTRLRHYPYFLTYLRFRKYTMVPPSTYAANLELVSKYKNISGAIVECGTWKGGMIAGVARTLGKNREYILCDSYEGLPDAEEIDGEMAKSFQENTESSKYHNNCTGSESDAVAAMQLSGVSNPQIYKGWFENTLPELTFPNGIAILRMDADWYSSTTQILDSLFPHLNSGALIIIDDYAGCRVGRLLKGCS
jgi:O-methyltransferase